MQLRIHRGRMTLPLLLVAIVCVVVLGVGFLVLGTDDRRPSAAGPTTADRPTASGTPSSAVPSGTPGSSTPSSRSRLAPLGVAGAESVWKTDIAGAPLAANSAAQAQNLAGQVAKYYGGVASFNAYQYNPTWYTVGAAEPTTNVAFFDCQRKGYTPRGLVGAGGQFSDVPIPSFAQPSVGRDGTLTVYRPSTDQLWNFWKLTRAANGGWQACWGGRIDDLSRSAGYFKNGFGASASGLASELGAVTINDARSGSIDHAIALAIPSAAHWKVFSWPAQRSDGNDRGADAIAEGTRFRLDPALDVDRLALTPMAKMVAKAAQRYGFIVTDKSGSVAVTAESGAPAQRESGTNPWPKMLNNVPSYAVMKNFPWRSLQALPFDYGKPTSG